MSRWGSILRSIFQFGSVGVAIAEATGLSGKEKASVALAHVINSLALGELEATDPSAAAGVTRGIGLINDGIVAVENSVGNLSGSGSAEIPEKTDAEKVERLQALEDEAADREAAEDAEDAERDARDLELNEKVDRAVEAAEKAAKAAERAAASAEKVAALVAAPQKKGK